MRILVCNDDGIGAEGLVALSEAARMLTPDVWIVAPERKWTAASHQLSFDRDLSLTKVAVREYACSGAPADCVVAAMTLLFGTGERPDLVLSGINDKINVGEDLAYSGTMAVAREATFWGIPALALSADGPGSPVPRAAQAIGSLLRVLWERRAEWWTAGCWLSLNLPSQLPARLVQTSVGRDKIGGACEIVEATPERTVFRLVRGRPGSSTAGDERAALADGSVAIGRHCWVTESRLPDDTVEGWNRALP
jgi:5'-nucleotidase